MHNIGSFLLLAASFVCAGSYSGPNVGAPELRNRMRAKAKAVVGSVADISTRYENGKPITLIHILEFSTALFPLEPNLVQVRLCGDQRALDAAVHTNITLVYNPASHSRLTGCLSLISSDPFADGSQWQTVTSTSHTVKPSMRHD
jgi:hypothetical protein